MTDIAKMCYKKSISLFYLQGHLIIAYSLVQRNFIMWKPLHKCSKQSAQIDCSFYLKKHYIA